MLGIICVVSVICLTIILMTGIIFLCIKTKCNQKEQMTRDICNTVEKMVIAVKGK